jgi:hypothetical protein
MAESAAPAFFRVNYHSAYGPHTLQVPTLEWVGGLFTTWASGTVADDVMITDYVTALLPFYPSTVVFDNFLVFTQASPSSDPLPVNSGTFTSLVGSAGTPGWTKAVQLTMSVRSDTFGVAKYVFLDAASGNNFDPIRTADGSMTALMTVLSDVANGFAARNNGRPNTFIGLTKTLNEKLRKAYRMA